MTSEAMAEMEGEEQSEIELAIAEQIVILSQASEAPTEFEATGRAFDQNEVDFGSSASIACLAEVQGWLRLSGNITLVDQHQFLETLALGLGFDDAGGAVESIEGQHHLTPAGLDRLNVRLQRAVQLQGEFLAGLEAEGALRRRPPAGG